MLGASRASRAALLDRIREQQGAGGIAVAEGLLVAADACGSSAALATALTDAGLEPAVRAGIATDLLGPAVNPAALPTLQWAVAQRWSRAGDLVPALEAAAATQAFIVAEGEERITAVEDGIFAFERAVAANGDLQLALNDPALTPAQRVAIARDLLTPRFDPIATMLICHAVGHTSERLDWVLTELLELAAQSRGRVLAEVTTALPLTDTERERLGAALMRIYRRPVQIQAIIDPSVIGGVRVSVGDELIDGTLAARREALARSLTG